MSLPARVLTVAAGVVLLAVWVLLAPLYLAGVAVGAVLRRIARKVKRWAVQEVREWTP